MLWLRNKKNNFQLRNLFCRPDIGLDMTKPVFGASDKVRIKSVCLVTMSRLQLEISNFTCSKFRYDTIQKVNKKGADQSVYLRRLVCTFVVRKPGRQVFLRRDPLYGPLSREKLSSWLPID